MMATTREHASAAAATPRVSRAPAHAMAADAPASSGRSVAGRAVDPLAAVLARSVQQRTLARWHVVNSGAYAHASPGGAIGSPFVWQEEAITVQPRPGMLPGRGIRYVQHTPAAAPDLKVSADNTVAMQDSTGQAKEAYVSPGVRAAANAALAGTGSPIKLGKAGHTITLNAFHGVAGQTLEKVRPQITAGVPGAAHLNAADFPTLAAVVCRDLAQSILGGNLTHIRLSDTAGNTRSVAADATDANIVGGSQQLAKAVGDGKISLKKAARKMALAKVPTPSKTYGKATRKAKFNQRARNLGINEHAWATPGEAYVIQSAYGKGGDNTNYSDPHEAAVVGGFGYHFAAAVAESADGRDALTLENYRRTGEVDTAAAALLADLRNRYAAHLNAAFAGTGGALPNTKDEIGQILHYIETNTAADYNQAIAKWNAVLREGVTPGALWYFRMVSRDHAHQTFHGQNAPSGWFVSPITFVMTR